MAKDEIAHREQFHLLPLCFQKSSAADAPEMVLMRKRVKTQYYYLQYTSFKALINLFNPFPHMTILQQTTLNIFCQNIENLHN